VGPEVLTEPVSVFIFGVVLELRQAFLSMTIILVERN
jgi:hypothetical protein